MARVYHRFFNSVAPRQVALVLLFKLILLSLSTIVIRKRVQSACWTKPAVKRFLRRIDPTRGVRELWQSPAVILRVPYKGETNYRIQDHIIVK
jgi:hypothetical protein